LYFALSIDNSDLVFASLIFEVVTVFLVYPQLKRYCTLRPCYI
jgi:hypothetical protein